MINFLQSYTPSPVMISFWGIEIYWYGFFIVLGILAGLAVTLILANYYKISRDVVFDLAFWMVVAGIIGSRIYHVLIHLPYYIDHAGEILRVWEGGLAIHGALIAGIVVMLIYVAKKNIFTEEKEPSIKNFWLLAAITAPALALAQAIGRWGNYFNQELFGKPTDLPWGVNISIMNRPVEYLSSQFFHPTFLYESLGSLLIFLILIALHVWYLKKKKRSYEFIILFYAAAYSLLRFGTEIFRIDQTPEFLGLRLPQIVSIVVILAVLVLTVPQIRRRIT